jgi:hypothetical protein
MLDNPLAVSVLITLIIVVLIFLLYKGDTKSLVKTGIYTFMIVGCVMYAHDRNLKNVYDSRVKGAYEKSIGSTRAMNGIPIAPRMFNSPPPAEGGANLASLAKPAMSTYDAARGGSHHVNDYDRADLGSLPGEPAEEIEFDDMDDPRSLSAM